MVQFKPLAPEQAKPLKLLRVEIVFAPRGCKLPAIPKRPAPALLRSLPVSHRSDVVLLLLDGSAGHRIGLRTLARGYLQVVRESLSGRRSREEWSPRSTSPGRLVSYC